jgi:hypothetical protein
VSKAAAVVIAAADVTDQNSAAQLLAAADHLRQRSGQGHRPWEIRARLADLDDGVVTPIAAAESAAHAGRQYDLSAASELATRALRSLATSAAT